MKKQTKGSYIHVTAEALIADAIAQNTPPGTLGRKHTEQIALRYAIQSRAMYRANQFKKFLVFSGVIGLVIFIISNWH